MSLIVPPQPLRRVQSCMIDDALARGLEATADSLASPMVPASTAWAARELLAHGCEALERALDASAPPLRARHPPRGRPPSDSAARRDDARARQGFTRLAPIALPPDLIERLEALRARWGRAGQSGLTDAIVFREALTAGLAERAQRQQQAREAFAAYEAALRAIGRSPPPMAFPVAFGVLTPYRPRGRRSATARAGASAPNTATPPTPRSKAAARGRSARQRPSRKRTSADDEDGDDGGEGPARTDAIEVALAAPPGVCRAVQRLVDALIELELSL